MQLSELDEPSLSNLFTEICDSDIGEVHLMNEHYRQLF